MSKTIAPKCSIFKIQIETMAKNIIIAKNQTHSYKAMNHTVQLSPFERDLLKFSIIKFGKLNKCAKKLENGVSRYELKVWPKY